MTIDPYTWTTSPFLVFFRLGLSVSDHFFSSVLPIPTLSHTEPVLDLYHLSPLFFFCTIFFFLSPLYLFTWISHSVTRVSYLIETSSSTQLCLCPGQLSLSLISWLFGLFSFSSSFPWLPFIPFQNFSVIVICIPWKFDNFSKPPFIARPPFIAHTDYIVCNVPCQCHR